ncbi:hypothetical protein [Streptomyces murinus]|uniref:hypothetical protein n=1 Tax=Streptomyces murinus TaxID=33900 RepID=UPI0037FB83AF
MTQPDPDLRDRTAEALARSLHPDLSAEVPPMDHPFWQTYQRHANAILSVLFGPIPAGTDTATWTAIRAIQLMNEAGRRRDRYRSAWCSARERAQAYGEGILRHVADRDWWEKQAHAVQARAEVENRAAVLLEAADAGEDVANRIHASGDDHRASGAYDVVDELRRLAGEAQQDPAHAVGMPCEHGCRAAGAELTHETRQDEADAATAEHHTVDGVRYLCHTDDHYCPREARRDPAPGGEERVKHSGPTTKFCVLCLSGEHEPVDDAAPAWSGQPETDEEA